MFLTIYMHQFGWLSERGGQIFKFVSERGGTQKGGRGSFRKGGRGVPNLEVTMLIKVVTINMNPMFTNFSLNIFIYKEIWDYWCYYTSSG